ncbi:hypothetical protein AL522_05905 [Pantoea vagans]|nr:hypothetical protein AL522_05905 [Pantoea vagans]
MVNSSVDFYQIRRAALLIAILVRTLISKKRRILLNSFSKTENKKARIAQLSLKRLITQFDKKRQHNALPSED